MILAAFIARPDARQLNMAQAPPTDQRVNRASPSYL
jgi:hypothetical protein